MDINYVEEMGSLENYLESNGDVSGGDSVPDDLMETVSSGDTESSGSGEPIITIDYSEKLDQLIFINQATNTLVLSLTVILLVQWVTTRFRKITRRISGND